MNENLNLVEILKDCPCGTKLYSPIYGYVEFVRISQRAEYPIEIKLSDDSTKNLTKDGVAFASFRDVECMLFPSREHRDWSKFNPKQVKKPKFDPRTVKPFDRVLVRDSFYGEWICTIFSHIRKNDKNPYMCANLYWNYCIPYNDDTKHLVGTTDEAPDFYKYWED